MGHCPGVVDLPVWHSRRLQSLSIVASISRLACRVDHLLLCPCLRWFVLLHKCEVSLHIHHPSRECRLCICRVGCSYWRQPAASCSTSRRHHSGCCSTGVGRPAAALFTSVVKPAQIALRKFHLSASLPCTGWTRDGMVMSDGRWCDWGNMSRMCITGSGWLLCHFANSRSGLMVLFHRAE